MIVITGASGFIGGQIALKLADNKQQVLGIDRRPCHKGLSGAFAEFVQGDFADQESLTKIIKAQPRAIIHCAGTSLVGPSMTNPAEYYQNNVVKTMTMLDIVRSALPRTRVIFSSSASVYGEPIMNPCHEVDPCEPISPYGESKRMVEQILASYHRAYNLDYVAFRYFNACGADSQARHGQASGATHIIARVLEALRDDQEFTLNGVDFPTPDGTCVRDYVHVEDIARAHVMALDAEIPSGVYNLGNNNGVSNREIIAAAECITGRKLKVIMGEARPGDPAVLTASAAKFGQVAEGWRQFKLDHMIQHAWTWYVKEDNK